ncbi:LOG family protein [Pararhodospirillum oryzae]|uniref:Cytokinin riboside 5'-monophosphate phosphoribohydrolase n=1 Tax=Pararhodospirillum oryzae TaxID=478448 RepID=A0A512HAK2_9PROT|nr:TIGR00730 family Rossman fold protein [Pararhodospirillum oryzae]GEO82465.1 cytokinin riboside 5'-monophosphate phosphoribohydrolase [Pararhodospirillum oryzae]
MTALRSLCVFCGSAPGGDPRFMAQARLLGTRLAEAGVTLVFGAGNVGLMGGVALAALEAGGEVVGVIPEHLTRVETPDAERMELHVVGSMHERKRLMFDRSDAVCILPGGIGTLDETFEILTWRQLGLHDRPVILVNVAGYWDGLVALVDRVVSDGFAKPHARDLFTLVDDVEAVLPAVRAELAAPRHREEARIERF